MKKDVLLSGEYYESEKNESVVQTGGCDVRPAACILPATLMHEHITIDLSGVKNDRDCRLDCMDATIQEMQALKECGVYRVVDVTNSGMGRNPEYVERVAHASGMEIVMSTGFYKEPFFPDEVYRSTEKQLAEKMCDEIENGIAGSKTRARLIGEIGSSADGFTAYERKVFRAAARAHCITGVTISTHTTLGKFGMEQVELLTSLGVEHERIIIGHADLSADLEYLLRLLDCGVTIGFDTIGKKNYLSDTVRIELLRELCARKFSNQIVMSVDITRKSQLGQFGGYGYVYFADKFLPALRAAGVAEADIVQMTVINPQRLLEK